MNYWVGGGMACWQDVRRNIISVTKIQVCTKKPVIFYKRILLYLFFATGLKHRYNIDE